MINGCPTHLFKSSRGLRQGFPLSPSLYILMVDSLSRKLEEEHRLGRLSGIQIAPGVKEINHSQFADDILLLGGASSIIARIFKMILDQFISVSRGQVNSHKFHLYF